MKLFIFLFLLSSELLFAEVLEVHSVVPHGIRENTWIVKFTDGRVGFWNEDSQTDLSPESLKDAVIDGVLSAEAELSQVRVIGEATTDIPVSGISKGRFEYPPYTPTVYPSYGYATDVLRSMRRSWIQDSQCYDRSHIWAYEEAYAGRYLQKFFLFFSDAYIARYNFPWWFHTAPYALVRLNGEVVERVMDPGFVEYPLKTKLWTDLFMRNKAECKLVAKYSDYSRHPGEDDCYLIKSSVYFWQPKDLDAFERSGIEKRRFIDWEVRHAYRYGFGL